MKILLTRSEPGASRMAAELAAAGLQPLVAPLLVAEPTHADHPADRYSHVIFVSEHAVSFAHRALRSANNPLVSIAPQARWYAIGPATEATLAAALAADSAAASVAGNVGLPEIVVPEPARSEGLLEHESLQSIARDKVLIVAGVGGRAMLFDTLQARGARVTTWRVYRRTEQAPQKISSPGAPNEASNSVPVAAQSAHWADAVGADLVVASSGQGVELLTRHWSDDALQVPICVPSPRVYNLALKLGWQKPVNCPGASATDVLAGLSQQGLWPPESKD